jgi:hypothetical protein
MRRLTSGWTELHLPLGAAAFVTAAAGWTAAGMGGAAGALTVAVIAVVCVLALMGDVSVGLTAGVFGAAAIAAAGNVDPASATRPAAVIAAAGLVLTLGALSGAIGEGIRRGRRRAARIAQGAVLPASGTLGLLSYDDAHRRLEEELVRACLHERPLSVAMVRVVADPAALAAGDLHRVHRAVARLLETNLRVTDVPFAGAAAGEFGVILPETGAEAAGDVLASVLILAQDTTYGDRAAGRRRFVGEAAVLHLGVTDARAMAADDAINASASTMELTRGRMVQLAAWTET